VAPAAAGLAQAVGLEADPVVVDPVAAVEVDPAAAADAS
jgi:hypothetical protein